MHHLAFVFDVMKTSNADMDQRGKNGSHAFSTSLLSQHVKTLLSQCLLPVGSQSKHTHVGPTPQGKQQQHDSIWRRSYDANGRYPLTMPCDLCKVMNRIPIQHGGDVFLSLIMLIKYAQSACSVGSLDWILAVTVILSASCVCTVTVDISSRRRENLFHLCRDGKQALRLF